MIYYLQDQSHAGFKWDDITGIPLDFQDGIDDINDADSDPGNELNTSLTSSFHSSTSALAKMGTLWSTP